jgi:hypothetical protein
VDALHHQHPPPLAQEEPLRRSARELLPVLLDDSAITRASSSVQETKTQNKKYHDSDEATLYKERRRWARSKINGSIILL